MGALIAGLLCLLLAFRTGPDVARDREVAIGYQQAGNP
jgi:hypothetical protein